MQRALVLIERRGGLRVAGFCDRAPEDAGYMTAAVRGVAGCRFIKVDDEQAVASGSECGRVGYGNDYIRLQPGICLLWRSVMCVVVYIGNDVGELGQRAIRKVGGELGKRPDGLIRNRRIARDIGEHGEGVMADEIEAGVSADVTTRYPLCIDPERDVSRQHVP